MNDKSAISRRIKINYCTNRFINYASISIILIFLNYFIPNLLDEHFPDCYGIYLDARILSVVTFFLLLYVFRNSGLKKFKHIDQHDDSDLWQAVNTTARQLNISTPPKIYMSEGKSATMGGMFGLYNLVIGKNLLEISSETELKGIIAHELGHGKNGDLEFHIFFCLAHLQYASLFLILTIKILSKCLGYQSCAIYEYHITLPLIFIATYFLEDHNMISAPLKLFYSFMRRRAEYEADKIGAMIIGDPDILADHLCNITSESDWHTLPLLDRLRCYLNLKYPSFSLRIQAIRNLKI